MKRTLHLFKKVFFAVSFTLLSGVVFAQGVCQNFEGSIPGWSVNNATVSNQIGTLSSNLTGFLRGRDNEGTSFIFNDANFRGSMLPSCGGEFTWSYKIFEDGDSRRHLSKSPDIIIYMGPSPLNATVSAVFRATSITVNETSAWRHNIRARIGKATGSLLPPGWTMVRGAVGDFNNLVANFTGVAFGTDINTTPTATEVIGIDNLCLVPYIEVQASDIGYNFADNEGYIKAVFCHNENINLYAFSLSDYPAYFIDAWRRPINSAPNTNVDWYAEYGWTNGTPGTVNLTAAFASLNPPVYFEPGYEYEIKLAVADPSRCIGWTEIKKRFAVEYCGGDTRISPQAKQTKVLNAAEPRIAPNPSKGEMTLSMQAPGDLVLSVDVINAQGSRVKTIARNTYKGGQFNTQLSLGAAAKGVYTVVFHTNYGTFRKKVIVQ